MKMNNFLELWKSVHAWTGDARSIASIAARLENLLIYCISRSKDKVCTIPMEAGSADYRTLIRRVKSRTEYCA